MTNIHKLSVSDRRYADATSWVTKLERGLSQTEEEALRAWMQARPENVDLFLLVAQTWDKMATLSRLSDLFPAPQERTVWRPRLAAAVVVAILVGVSIWAPESWINHAPIEIESTASTELPEFTTYETAIGEQSTIVLPDGSRVVVNTNSLLRVRYTPHHRILELLRGELHVNVASDVTRPLSVVVGNNIVQALGTSFGVEITSQENIRVVVTEGQVLIGMRKTPTNELAQLSAPVLPTSSLTVSQGEEIELGAPGAHIESVSPDEIEVKLSWRTGNLIFRSETLENALVEVGRYTTVEFVFVDESLKQEVISGRFKAGDIEGLLAVLRENVGVAYERTDDGRILLSSLQ